ncbi:MAG: urate hydroxylase PuuD [Usitatibacter sp.]
MSMEFIQYGIGRWVHIMAGVMWIGLLYYFNFVQVEAMKRAGADNPPTGAGITKHVAPRALFFFRWAAVVTVLMGLMILGDKVDDALFFKENAYKPIGIGAWLGLIMLFNVWVLIWPNQKKILGLVGATDEEKAKARRVAFLASRTNTALSMPMLFFMVASGGVFRRAIFGG